MMLPGNGVVIWGINRIGFGECMKVAYVIGGMFQGGAETLVFELCMNMSKEHTVLLWILVEQKNTSLEIKRYKQLLEKGIDVRFIEKRKNKDRFRSSLRLRTLMKSEKPDIVHAHMRHIAALVGVAAIGTGIPVVMTAHIGFKKSNMITGIIMRNCIDGFIGVSEGSVKSVVKHWNIDRQKTRVIKNGVDIKKFTCSERDYGGEVRNIISVGRLTHQKNFKLLINAYKKVFEDRIIKKKECPVLTIAGQGNLYNELIRQVKDLGLESHIKLFGIHDNIPMFMKEADLYVLSSLVEGHPIVLLEAVSSGLPVVSTDIEGVDGIVEDGENGILVKSNDEEELAAAIIELLDNNEKRKTFANNSAAMCHKFDFKYLIQEHAQYYNEIINKSAGTV